MKRIAQLEKSMMREDLPPFGSGDTLRVHVKIKEGDKERIQVFQGTVIGRRGGGVGETFTVRKVSGGVGVERVFPLHSPNVAKIEKIRSGRVRRAKLYYLRELTGKSARIREQITESAADKLQARVAAKQAEPEKKEEPAPAAAQPAEETVETQVEQQEQQESEEKGEEPKE